MNGGLGSRLLWHCSRKGQNKVAWDLESESPHYATSGMADSGEAGMRANTSLILFCLL